MNKKQKEKWVELYSVMQQIDELDPWHKIDESAVFIYRRKDGQEIFYRILGDECGVCGVACYIGENAYLDSKIVRSYSDRSRNAFCLHNALIGLYDDREYVSKEDREVLKAIDLKCRGKGGWLHFNAYGGGRLPRRLTDEELGIFADALGNLYMMLNAVFSGKIPVDNLKKTAVLRFRDEKEEDLWYNAPSSEYYARFGRELSVSFTIDKKIRPLASRKATGASVAIITALSSKPVKFDDGTTSFSFLTMLVDTATGVPIELHNICPDEDLYNSFLGVIVDYCMENGKPKEILFDEPMIETIAGDACRNLKINLRRMSNAEEIRLYDSLQYDAPNSITEKKNSRPKVREYTDVPDTTYVISVSLGTGLYRHISLSGQYTLEQLSEMILEAFEFDNDHMHAFFLGGRYGDAENTYFSHYDFAGYNNGEKGSCDYFVGDVLEKGQKFTYLFDFGDNWEFACRVLKVIDKPCEDWEIIRAVGDPPEQYPCYDDEEDFE